MKRPEERLTPGAKAIRMPCGWGCGANLTSTEMRGHFKRCPNRGGAHPDAIRLMQPEAAEAAAGATAAGDQPVTDLDHL